MHANLLAEVHADFW